MGRHHDWIPTKEQDLVDLCRNWALILGRAANVAKWGWDGSEASLIVVDINAFIVAREVYATNKTALNHLEKDQRKTAAVAAMRSFAKTSIRFNKKMTEADRLSLGIRPKDMEPTVDELETENRG